MSLPKVAIVGRPNVGKSSLLNRLARRQVSIVDPTPGVTRDRVSVLIELEPPKDTPKGTPSAMFELIDTGGYGVYTAENERYNEIGTDLASLTPDIEYQIRAARDQAQLILFIIDAQTGLTRLDQTVAQLLRQEGAGDKVLMVANKVDGDSWVSHGMEGAALGFGEPVCISATSGFNARQFTEALYNRLGDNVHGVPDADPVINFAIVGKRNAGKSTLINALAGEERVIVSEIAGTTRDSVDVRFEIDGQTLVAIDTAGVRKRKSFSGDIEYYAYHRMLAATRRADVAVLLVDASEEISQVDKKLAMELQRQFKPTVIVVNKIDTLNKDVVTPESYQDYLTEQLRGLSFAPIIFVSAKDKDGLEELVSLVFNVHAQASHRETTGQINKVVEEILKERGPSSRLGKQAKLFYATQVATNPPTLVLVVNDPKLFAGRYERYLMNRLREHLPFSEVPIRVVFKKRSRMDLQVMKETAGARARARGNVADS